MQYRDELLKHHIFSVIGAAADDTGVEAYVIGGYVRDLLLNRPSKDIDIVCVGSGIDLAKKVARAIDPDINVSVFKNFGTAMLKADDWEVEFVGARKESYNRDSRKPIVEDGTLEDDQNRRDFTINAMAIALNSDRFGELVDPFDGEKDLKEGIIQTPLEPKATFSDDPLRMMRAVRFAAQLKFDIEPDTFEAIQEMADRIEIISYERISDELNKMILAPKPSFGFELLYHAGLLERIFFDFVNLKGVEKRDGHTHKDNFYHTLEVLDNIAENTDNLWLRWAAILHDIAKPRTKRFSPKAGWTFHGHEDKGARMVPGIFRRMKLPMNEKMRYVQKLVRLHLRPIALVKENITDSALRRLLYEAGDDVHDLLTLCRADVTSKNDHKVRRYLKNFDYVEKKLVEVEEKDRVRNFQPIITGEIIMETFDIKPSRVIGEIKEEIKEAILEGEIHNNYEEAYQHMLKLGQKKGLTPKK